MAKGVKHIDQFRRPFPVRTWHWVQDEMAVTCPNCGQESRFYPATVKPLSRSEADSLRTADFIEVFEVKDRARHPGSAFFGAFYHSMGQMAPQGWEPSERFATDIGTLRCLSCCLCRRHDLDWTETAHFQLDFDGQLLWLYNRGHVTALIDMLKAKNPRELPWIYWFNNKLPAHFKTDKARKTLPDRLRKLLL